MNWINSQQQSNLVLVRASIEDDVQVFVTVDEYYVTASLIPKKCEHHSICIWFKQQSNHFFVPASIEDDVQIFRAVVDDHVTAPVITKMNWINSQQQSNPVLVRAFIEDDVQVFVTLDDAMSQRQ
jgi:hypothetical protein